ncbi:hypothetical protein [Paludisphaera mucosa]|uniref:Uncharacterized protein n=1 Tax=Paludisphaera mucosa TaxID=3030827 RepID=A0ABT6F7B9_9BACT|nr:hypothetical protein [Paludisphaera mucosa]MDG3003468.1 hypothetical protein [Paludisphaera mucosa]
MFRLRDAVAAVALAMGGIGCATFCDECDDFPVPGRYAALPGSYTGPPLEAEPRYRGPGATADPLSPSATRESGTTPAPASSDDSAGSGSGPGATATPPPAPPAQPAAGPFTPPSATLPQLP